MKVLKNISLFLIIVGFALSQHSLSLKPIYGDFVEYAKNNDLNGYEGKPGEKIPGLPDWVVPTSNMVLNELGIVAEWNLFAPEMGDTELFAVVEGEMHNGTIIDLSKALRSYDWETIHVARSPRGEPENYAYLPSLRTHALFKRVLDQTNKWMACQMAEAFCRNWNRGKTKEFALKKIDVIAQVKKNHLATADKPYFGEIVHEETAWMHRCVDVYAGATGDYGKEYPTQCMSAHPGIGKGQGKSAKGGGRGLKGAKGKKGGK